MDENASQKKTCELTFAKLRQIPVEELDKLGRECLKQGKRELWGQFVATCDTPYEIDILSAIVLQMAKLKDGDSLQDIITSIPKSLGIEALEKISKGVALFCPNGMILKMYIEKMIVDKRINLANMQRKFGLISQEEYEEEIAECEKFITNSRSDGRNRLLGEQLKNKDGYKSIAKDDEISMDR